MKPRALRRWWLPRLSLRTGLLLMLVLGAALGVVGNFWRRVQHQRQVVSAIEGAGGYVKYGYELGSGPEVKYEFNIDRHPTDHFYTYPPGHPQVISDKRFGTPPGPQLLRRFFGDHAFATIEEFGVVVWRHSPHELDPQILRGLTDLRYVHLDESLVSDESMRIVAQLPHVRCLALSGKDGRVSSANLLLLKEARQLEGLQLSGRWVTDDVLRSVGQLTHLKYFSLTAAPNVTSAGLQSLVGLKQLEEIELMNVEGCSTQFLSELTELKSLFVHQVVPFELEPVKHLKKLQRLTFYNKTRTRPDLNCLEALSELQVLWLLHTHLENGDLHPLTRLPKLRDLILRSSEVSDEGVATIVKLAALQKLELEAAKATDPGICQLKSLSNLRWLGVRQPVSQETVNVLHAALPHCELDLRDSTRQKLSPSP